MTGAAASRWPGIFLLDFPQALRIAGTVLIGLGLVMWAAGVITVMPAYNRDELVTTGVFALVRHPVYAAWMTMIFPGLALFTGAWPLFLIAVIAYAIFKRLIRHEEEYLEHRFGKTYLDYCRRVHAVLPVRRFWN